MIPAGDELARLAWAQAWQVTALIVVVAVAVRLLARNRPHLAYVLWLIVLIKCITPPVWSSPGGVFCWLQFGHCDPSLEADRLVADSVEKNMVRRLPRPGPPPGVEGSPLTECGSLGGVVAVSPTRSNACRDSARTRTPARPPVGSGRPWPLAAVMTGWVVGVMGVLGLAAGRWIVGLRRIRRSGCRSDPSLDRLVASLSRRLRLWRPARLVVTKSLVGPAVIGLFRPTVLLPEIVVRDRSAADLEPILAHELIHVRRGDLWVGMLQMLARATWWFHPLVWWAGRLASREAERCCDEAVLAELGCNPAQYAQCLFDVLKRKHVLKSLPTFPGVRPVEVTSQRLERIMRLGQGSRKRSPWWCWAVILLAAAVTLPGAALVAGADDDGASAEPARAKTPPPQVSAPADDDNSAVAPAPSAQRTISDAVEIDVRFISAPAEVIDEWDVNWTVLPTEVSAGAETPQRALDATLAAAGRPLFQDRAGPRSLARVVVEKNLPLTFAVLDEEQATAIREHFQDERRANILAAPKVTVLSGQSAFVSDRSQSPFVVGVEDGKPRFRVISEGRLIRLRPLLLSEGSLRLDYEVTLSKIRNVETASVTGGPNGEAMTLQIPEVETTRLDASVEFPIGKTLLIGGLKTKDGNGDVQSMMVMLRPEKTTPDQASIDPRPIVCPFGKSPAYQAPADSVAYTVAYSVADLVMPSPFPGNMAGRYDPPETTDKPDAGGPDFDPLIELITSTILPVTWENVGGRGSIAPFHTNSSLVVSQTQAVHEAIRDLLEQLREMRNARIALDAEIVHLPGETVEQIAVDPAPEKGYTIIGPRDARALRASVEGSKPGGIRHLAKMTLFHGQITPIWMQPEDGSPPAGDRLLVVPSFGPRLPSVHLLLAVNPKDIRDTTADWTRADVSNGHTLLLDVTGKLQAANRSSGIPLLEKVSQLSRSSRDDRDNASTERTFLLLTPKILVTEEVVQPNPRRISRRLTGPPT